ncbi:MAG: hypothetical protein HQK92_03850 [Nitrospirae bacterium]|nr:hypothetical protein [Nitrospirota bacterium]
MPTDMVEITETEVMILDRNETIQRINHLLSGFSVHRLKTALDFVEFLDDRQKRHDAFVAETLHAMANPDYIECETAEEAMDVIRNWAE